MGIRFLCPNGHKLNVKSFQAGKRGICPHCGARFTIPKRKHPARVGQSRTAQTPLMSTTRKSSRSNPPNRLLNKPRNKPQSQPRASRQPFGEQIDVNVDQPVVPPTVPPQSADPLAEAPGASWYVSPPGGGQFGPANADIDEDVDRRRPGDRRFARVARGLGRLGRSVDGLTPLGAPRNRFVSAVAQRPPTRSPPRASQSPNRPAEPPGSPSGVLGAASLGDSRRATRRSAGSASSPCWWWCCSSFLFGW